MPWLYKFHCDIPLRSVMQYPTLGEATYEGACTPLFKATKLSFRINLVRRDEWNVETTKWWRLSVTNGSSPHPLDPSHSLNPSLNKPTSLIHDGSFFYYYEHDCRFTMQIWDPSILYK